MKRLFEPLSVFVLLVVMIYLFRYGFTGYPTAGAAEVNSGGRNPGAPMDWLESPRLLPEFHFVDDAGQERSLADFRGKVVLLNIWATWCPPCRTEMPSLDRLQLKLGGEELPGLACFDRSERRCSRSGVLPEVWNQITRSICRSGQ